MNEYNLNVTTKSNWYKLKETVMTLANEIIAKKTRLEWVDDMMTEWRKFYR